MFRNVFTFDTSHYILQFNMAATTILVVGATGKQGGQVMATLLNSGRSQISLRFLTRNKSSPNATELISKGATAVVGNLSDRQLLLTALKGVDRAYLVTDAGAGEEKEAELGINFVEAAKEAGVSHMVLSSVSAADLAKDVPHFRSKAKVERSLQASGMSYTILRPVAFMDNFPVAPGFARFMVVGMFYAAIGGRKCQLISVKDIGTFGGMALLDPDSSHFHNAILDLSGGNYDISDVRHAVYAAQAGGQPWFATYTPKLVRRLLPYDFRQMMIYLERVGYPDIDTAKLREIYPDLMTLEQYFRQDL